jgi:hypothetical protein
MNEDLGKEERLWGEDALVDAPFCEEIRSEKKTKTCESSRTCIHRL